MFPWERPCAGIRDQGSKGRSRGAGAKGRLAAISGPSRAPSPGPVFIPRPRLLTRVADTRPGWPRPRERRGRRAAGSLPGGSHPASPRPGTEGGGRLRPCPVGAPAPDAAVFLVLLGTPAPAVLPAAGSAGTAGCEEGTRGRAGSTQAGVSAHVRARPAPLLRPQVHHRQRSGGELRRHLLQRRLLRAVWLLARRGDAAALHLRLPARAAHAAPRRRADRAGPPGGGGAQSGDRLLPERR